MLAILRRWFRRAPVVTSTRPATPARVTAPRASAAGPAGPAVPAVPAVHDVVTEAALAADLRARAEALLEATRVPNEDAAHRAGLAALAAAVVDAPADAVRQLPSAAREALAVCDDSDAGSADLARVCEVDLAVARALLREANSTFYAVRGQSPAASLREAIDRVGTGGVRGVLVDVTVAALLCPSGSRHAAITAAIWAHAQRTGALARAAAGAFGVSPERAYTAGLLHDVGKLVLLDRAAALGEQRAAPPVAWPALRAALIALHEPLGALTVLRWGMGADAARAIATHHRTPAPDAPDMMSEILFVAERVDHASRNSEPLDLEALWAEFSLTGSYERAAHALARHLGPMTPFAVEGDGARAPRSSLVGAS